MFSYSETVWQQLTSLLSHRLGQKKHKPTSSIHSPRSQPRRNLEFSERISPFHDVPSEILEIIFDFACDTNCFRVVHPVNLSVEASKSLRSKPALVLSSVCSRWRRNAFNLPQIWSRIRLEWLWHLEEFDAEKHEDRFFPLVNFFCRSLEFPLTIHLANTRKDLVHPKLKQLLMLNMGRLQSLTFKSSAYVFDVLVIGLPGLSELIDVTLMDGSYPNCIPTLCVTSGAFGGNSRQSYHLSHLQVLQPDENDMMLFPSKISTVEVLMIEDTYTGNSFREIPLATTCTSVMTLNIRHHHGVDPSHSVLPFLTLPTLQKLSFEPAQSPGPCFGYWSAFPTLIDLLRRSDFHLTTLSLESLPISDSNLVLLLSLLPSIIDLSISDTHLPYIHGPITMGLVESLHAKQPRGPYPQSAPLVPKLQSLALYTQAQTKFDDALVLEMVCSRWKPSASLAESCCDSGIACLGALTLGFQNREEVISDVYMSLEELEQEGMRVVVFWKRGTVARCHGGTRK